MQQLEFFSLPNPCVGVCEANSKGYCKGCWRTREERQNWQQFSLSEKRRILNLTRLRKHKLIRELIANRQLQLDLASQSTSKQTSLF